ncbi:MAG: MBL fold metallo-hydrolase [Alphaproteobacteria bacterium]
MTILGCGPSGGVPLIGCDCAVCASADPRNRRSRSSIAVEGGKTQILIDASPDLREQLLRSKLTRFDAIVFTHAHADHVHGLDELRSINYLTNSILPAYGDDATLADIRGRFGYAFEGAKPIGGFWYQPSLDPRPIDGPFTIGTLDLVPFVQGHGLYRQSTLGFRIGAFAYSTDVKDLPEESFAALAGVKVWVVDCLSAKPNPAHSHLDQTLDWIKRVRPERAILTHMNHSLEFEALARKLPAGVEPAYDGMVIEVPG